MAQPVPDRLRVECQHLCRFLVGDRSAEQDAKNKPAWRDWKVVRIGYYPDGRVQYVDLER